jgi:hypothetical protein
LSRQWMGELPFVGRADLLERCGRRGSTTE